MSTPYAELLKHLETLFVNKLVEVNSNILMSTVKCKITKVSLEGKYVRIHNDDDVLLFLYEYVIPNDSSIMFRNVNDNYVYTMTLI